MSNNFGNPAEDEWDGWGTPSPEDTPQSDNIWGSPNTDAENNWSEEQDGNVGGWDDMSSPQPPQEDIWGMQNQGAFIQPDNNFIPQEGGMSQNYQNFDDTGDLTAQIQPEPVKFNFGKKTVAFIGAGIILLLIFVLMFIDSIKISPKQTQTPQTQQPTQQVQQQQTDTTSQQQNVQGTSQGSAVLVEVPDSMDVSYSGDVHEANGKVTAKKKYVQGHQILYCVTINITFGSSSENISYYCNYNSYNQVSVGDVVVITYQQVNDNYISVNAIQK